MFRSRAILLDRCEIGIGIHVAGTGAVAKLTSGILNIRVLRFFVRAGFVITRVATGTVRLECRELPVNNLGVALVTFCASQIIPVILRLVRQARMAIVNWRPGIRVVTQTAILRRIEMPRVLSRRKRTVVARRAGPKHLVVVHVRHWCPHV
jgi:hypothetical protein